jgi:hypothetical protein
MVDPRYPDRSRRRTRSCRLLRRTRCGDALLSGFPRGIPRAHPDRRGWPYGIPGLQPPLGHPTRVRPGRSALGSIGVQIRPGGRGPRHGCRHLSRAPQPAGHPAAGRGGEDRCVGPHHRFRGLRRARRPDRPDKRRVRVAPLEDLRSRPPGCADRRGGRDRFRNRGHLRRSSGRCRSGCGDPLQG